jgi:hypothetical protein
MKIFTFLLCVSFPRTGKLGIIEKENMPWKLEIVYCSRKILRLTFLRTTALQMQVRKAILLKRIYLYSRAKSQSLSLSLSQKDGPI